MAKFNEQELDRVNQADKRVQELVNAGLIVNSDGQISVDWQSGDLISKKKLMGELSEALSELKSSLSQKRA